MCGIFAYLGDNYDEKDLINYLLMNKHRGPDNTSYLNINNKVFMGFNRLQINGINELSNQPFNIDGCVLICNGEIYNYKELIDKYELKDKYISNSDCEIIIHLYRKIGILATLHELDGAFSFALYDKDSNKMLIARDPIGIRSLYYSDTPYGFAIASEMKSLTDFDDVFQFPSGSYLEVGSEIVPYYEFKTSKLIENEKEIMTNIKELLIDAVEKRLMSDRPIGCLLSGGLDSTLVTAIVTRSEKYKGKKVNTYSIGLKGSIDLKYAKMASEYLGTNHTNIELSEKEFLDAIEKTIYQIESWDVTTIRASVGNYLVSLYIKDNSDDTVIFCGDVSDELFGSYRGFMNTDNYDDFLSENMRMIKDIRYFDVLRSDKSISGASLEARVPFADKKFMEYVMSIHPKHKMFSDDKIEKYILRKAFDGVLPKELLWRRKEAFSDGVSSYQRSWFDIIKEHVNDKYTESSYNILREKYVYQKPYDKESLYYREIFQKYYPYREGTIPYYWKHPFTTEKDPSARLLKCYTDDK
jgi:asparagine synthase (glutamine-hydrolysing)